MTVEELQAQVIGLEKLVKKRDREISRLQTAIEQERIYANAKSNLMGAQTFAQRARNRYLKLLLDNSKNIIICFDKNENIIFCSNILLKLTGMSEGDESGKHIDEIMHGFYDEEFINVFSKNLSEVIASNESRSFPVESVISGTGDKRKYIIIIISMSSSDIGNEGAMSIFHDVTDIERAREDAERASAAKSEFLSNMSHEMRTPMNAIIGMTAIARDSDSIESKEYCLKKIQDASTHLLGVINDILDMSKIEANKLELSLESFDFEKVIRKAVNVINFRIDEKHQRFIVDLDNSIPHNLIGDDQRLAQIITNLLSNAVKFTPDEGEVRLSARLSGRVDDSYIIQIAVTDTGIGISKEHQARLFRSFQQADSSTSRKFGGTGLGLAITRRLVEMMDGRIWIESELGQGATFAFTFRAEAGTEPSKYQLSEKVSWENVRLLIVDDAPEVLEYFRGETERLRIYCDFASSGEEALDLIARNGLYDIYFIDWKMPGMNGIKLTSLVKEKNRDRLSMVVMISSAEWNTIESDAKNAGVDRYLRKPLFRSDIIECLNESFGEKGADAETARNKDEDFSGFHILLVEDVDINREIVLSILEPTKLEIDCAENGAIAVEMVQQAKKPYDMIFMDLQMPEMDGFEATRRIRDFEKTSAAPEGPPKRLPIVAMTANVFREDIENCLKAGMDAHIGKPLDIEEVMGKLRFYLKAT
jgi:PAS domain S-box-containing protein